MKKNAFTLIELMVVVIIVGILASLAIGNYSKVVEKGRMAEAKKIMSVIRQQEHSYYLEQGVFTNCLTRLGFSDLPVTATCNGNHFYRYTLSAATGVNFNVTAIRCTSSGKSPNSPVSYYINLSANGTLRGNDSNYV